MVLRTLVEGHTKYGKVEAYEKIKADYNANPNSRPAFPLSFLLRGGRAIPTIGRIHVDALWRSQSGSSGQFLETA